MRIHNSLLSVFIGSSPHAWGRYCFFHSSIARKSVHPHMRGADFSLADFAVVNDGSSPHAWGRLPRLPILWLSVRFIPTCVGQMILNVVRYAVKAVHPHMRGADFLDVSVNGFDRGSSPHAWGRCRMLFSARFHVSVHPHMRGADGHMAPHRPKI